MFLTQSSLPVLLQNDPRRILCYLVGWSGERSSDSIFTRQREDRGTGEFVGKNIPFVIVPQETDFSKKFKAWSSFSLGFKKET